MGTRSKTVAKRASDRFENVIPSLRDAIGERVPEDNVLRKINVLIDWKRVGWKVGKVRSRLGRAGYDVDLMLRVVLRRMVRRPVGIRPLLVIQRGSILCSSTSSARDPAKLLPAITRNAHCWG